MRRTYRLLYKFETIDLAEQWLINDNPNEKYDFYIEETNDFYYNDIENHTLHLQSENNSDGGNNNSGENSTTISIPKATVLEDADLAITEDHIGLLAMQKVFYNNYPPESVNDLYMKAVLADTIPKESGSKGSYKLQLNNFILTPPQSKLIKVEFLQQPNSGSGLNIGSNHIKFTNGNISVFDSETEYIPIGIDAEATLNNLKTYIDANEVTLSLHIVESTSTYLVFEMYYSSTDEIKYLIDSSITDNSGNFNSFITGPVEGSYFDSKNNSAAIVTDETDNGDGYYTVISIGGQVPSVTLYEGTGIYAGAIYYNDGAYKFTLAIAKANGELSMVDNTDNNIIVCDISNVFPVWNDFEDIFTISTERELDLVASNKAKELSESLNIIIFTAYSWDGFSNNYNTIRYLVSYYSMYCQSSGQPHGVNGPWNLKYFENSTEALDAFLWALDNEDGGWFNTMFDIYSAQSSSETLEVEIYNKTIPAGNLSCYFTSNIVADVTPSSTTIIAPIGGKFERIPYTILGVISEVDGDNVLINTSPIMTLKMCSAEDGATYVLPYVDEFSYGLPQSALLAWRKGKVIDLDGYKNIMAADGFGDSSAPLYFGVIIGGMYRPLSLAVADGEVLADNKFMYLGNN